MRREIWLAIGLWVFGYATALAVAYQHPLVPVDQVPEFIGGAHVLREVLGRNLLILFILVIGCLTFGGVTAFQLTWLAMFFGLETAFFAATYGWEDFLRATVAHAPLEMASFVLATAAAFHAARHLLKAFLNERSGWALLATRRFMRPVLLATGMLLVAGAVEAYVTPLLLGGRIQ